MRRNVLVFVVTVVCLAAASQCGAQGLFLEAGQSGFGAFGRYWSSEHWSGVSGRLGYSFSGVFDLNGGIAKAKDDSEPELAATQYFAGAAWHLLKPSETLRFGLSAGAQYGKTRYNSDVLDALAWDMNASFYQGSVFAYGVVAGSSNFEIRPGIGFAYTQATLTIEDSFGGSLEEDDHFTSFILSAPVAFGLPSGARLRVTPSLEVGDETETLSVTIGALLPN